MTRIALIHEWDQDFDRYPLPICFDPREELSAFNRRRMRIERDVDNYLLTNQYTVMEKTGVGQSPVTGHMQTPGAENAANVAQAPVKSLGERRVRTAFNPSALGYVDALKTKGAEMINLIASAQPKPEWLPEEIGEFRRLQALAMTDAESATSWAVKMATS